MPKTIGYKPIAAVDEYATRYTDWWRGRLLDCPYKTPGPRPEKREDIVITEANGRVYFTDRWL